MSAKIGSSTTDYFQFVKMAVLKRYAKEFQDANSERYFSTSPYAITTETPQLRIVDNVIQTGRGNPISSSSSFVRGGFFNTVKGVRNNVSGGGWELDTNVQFDKIYMCPITNREFTEKDMYEYKESLRRECRAFAEDKLASQSLEIFQNPGSADMSIKIGNTVESFTYQDFMKFIGKNLW